MEIFRLGRRTPRSEKHSVSFWKIFKNIRVEFFRFFDIFSYFRYITQIKYPKNPISIQKSSLKKALQLRVKFFFRKNFFSRLQKFFFQKNFFRKFFLLYFVELFSLIIFMFKLTLFGGLMQALYRKYEKLHKQYFGPEILLRTSFFYFIVWQTFFAIITSSMKMSGVRKNYFSVKNRFWCFRNVKSQEI